MSRVVFYTYTGEGVSQPSGVQTLEPSLVPEKRGLALLRAAASCSLSLDLIFEDAAKLTAPSSPVDPSSTEPSLRIDVRPHRARFHARHHS